MDKLLKIAREICNIQGIKMHIQVPVLCPQCRNRTMIIDSVTNKAKCIKCKKEKHLDELLEEEQADWVEKHKGTDIEMRTNRGDCG